METNCIWGKHVCPGDKLGKEIFPGNIVSATLGECTLLTGHTGSEREGDWPGVTQEILHLSPWGFCLLISGAALSPPHPFIFLVQEQTSPSFLGTSVGVNSRGTDVMSTTDWDPIYEHVTEATCTYDGQRPAGYCKVCIQVVLRDADRSRMLRERAVSGPGLEFRKGCPNTFLNFTMPPGPEGWGEPVRTRLCPDCQGRVQVGKSAG